MTETLGVSGTPAGLDRQGIDRQRLSPDINQRDPERAGASAEKMLAEDAAQFHLERVVPLRCDRRLRVPAVRELRVVTVADEVGPEVGAIVLAERRRVAEDPPPVPVEQLVVVQLDSQRPQGGQCAPRGEDQPRIPPLPPLHFEESHWPRIFLDPPDQGALERSGGTVRGETT